MFPAVFVFDVDFASKALKRDGRKCCSDSQNVVLIWLSASAWSCSLGRSTYAPLHPWHFLLKMWISYCTICWGVLGILRHADLKGIIIQIESSTLFPPYLGFVEVRLIGLLCAMRFITHAKFPFEYSRSLISWHTNYPTVSPQLEFVDRVLICLLVFHSLKEEVLNCFFFFFVGFHGLGDKKNTSNMLQSSFLGFVGFLWAKIGGFFFGPTDPEGTWWVHDLPDLVITGAVCSTPRRFPQRFSGAECVTAFGARCVFSVGCWLLGMMVSERSWLSFGMNLFSFSVSGSLSVGKKMIT